MAEGKRTDPYWYKDAILYQLHIKSFYDSNGDGYGDIQGLIEKLDYIQDLGVDTIWVLPFYPSPLRDDGYDIADYETVNPVYGSEDDFRLFMKEAHRRGLRVVTELVINHTSDQHPWFQAARHAAKGSPERNFYVWTDDETKYKDARIIFTDTEKSNWTWDPVAKQYYWHRFFSHQPDLNFDNPEVLDAVIRTMLKWLEMGVDGLRLDAIPYLVEREGTNCENLPETHEILKKLRRAMDDHFENRVFLAEANQWPTEVREYFGSGDECHMAYNFPVMPRMYMAIHMEDRHPITDIMRETPAIPENCQWAMFLRNHDELTLEMVTDSERDYMYRAYAQHPLMRINVGIRRRLAPLMDYSRPKIQLMNSLLFSLPGTPIVYYGDEIAMGDNIYLSDRHGVRTPMQWSPDRNAGFSQAPFEQLYLPPIMDPVTGYQAINVEQQQLDPSSLLNWMKQIIKLRKRYKVFGRGTMEILDPSNRKIMAFIRKHEDETVLVVANLSRYPQAAEISLPGFQGVAPVEMFGLSTFPQIAEAPYQFTLGPYQFYWLLLSKVPESLPMPTSVLQETKLRESTAAARSSISIIEIKSEDPWVDLTSGVLKVKLESQVLPSFIARQRWYGAKSQEIKTARIVDWARLNIPAEDAGLFIVEVESAEGEKNLYSMYLSIASGYRAKQMIEHKPQRVLAELRRRAESLAVYDALQSDMFCKKLLRMIGDNDKVPMQSGELESEATPSYEMLRALGATEGIKRVTVEQSNSSIIYGQRYILKLYRKLQQGTNPDYDALRFLTEKAKFGSVPAVAGSLTYRKADNIQRYMVGMLQQFFVNQGDGWKHTVEEFRRFYERAESRAYLIPKVVPQDKALEQMVADNLPPEVNNMLGIYLEEAEKLGLRTGQMHCALASEATGRPFGAEPISKNELAQIVKETHEHIEKICSVLQAKQMKVPPEQRQLISNFLSRKQQAVQAVTKLNDASSLMKIRCHGDYHLGQVLNTFDDFVIFDFEGEPGRTIEERVQKHSPLKDVAGMVRSFSYGAYASLFMFAHKRPEDVERFLPWASACSTWSAVAFLKGYRAATAGQPFLPSDDKMFFEALVPFVVDKAIYEIGYELNNRPDWLSIPITGLIEYLNSMQPGRTANVR
ncbi:MAG TPA: maltose alpha-D-glucosyltransferase [Candidatus Obscuribacterales bacterium]